MGGDKSGKNYSCSMLRFFSSEAQASLALRLTPLVDKHRAARNYLHVCNLPVIHHSYSRRYESPCLCLYLYFFLALENNTYTFIWSFWRFNFSQCESREQNFFSEMRISLEIQIYLQLKKQVQNLYSELSKIIKRKKKSRAQTRVTTVKSFCEQIIIENLFLS